MADFDPYYKWLGIRPEEQPPNHYRLLAVSLFESDREVLSDAAQQRMAHVRTYQLGRHVELSQRILNELATAKLCLLTPEKKAEYDRQLRERLATDAAPAPAPPASPPTPPVTSMPPSPGVSEPVSPSRGVSPRRLSVAICAAVDRLLARLAGEGNAVLHNFLRLITVMALVGGVIVGGAFYRQWRADRAKLAGHLAAAQAADEEAARKKAEEEARKKAEEKALRKAEEKAAQEKAEEEAAQEKAEEEAARKKAVDEAQKKAEEKAQEKAEEEAAKKKAEEEAAQKMADEEAARRRQVEDALRNGFDLGGGVRLELVLIPAGEFLMGDENEKPVHKVHITKAFHLGKYEVTQEQWEAVMGNKPSDFKGAKNPVENVSWDDCQQFLAKLNAKFGRTGGTFRLPTEAEWEYACRAGAASTYNFGDDAHTLGDYAWFYLNAHNVTHPVGEKKPNAWGLYDMHGNVWEWCQDWYVGSYYGKSPADDPPGPTTGADRVRRGGSWGDTAGGCRAARRRFGSPGGRSDDLGLRACLVPAE